MSDQSAEDRPTVSQPEHAAVGLPGIYWSMKYAVSEMGPKRAAQTLLKMNHIDGFDCPSCAWPDPDRRRAAEFCENGAKAVAWEATRKRVGAEFFVQHSVADLLEHDDHWLEQPGPADRADVRRTGRHPLRADHVGGGVPAGRRSPRRSRLAGPSGVLHIRPRLQRSGVRVPAAGSPSGHQQPPGLLQHVPRVQRHRPHRDVGRRQGDRHLRRHRVRVGSDPDRRPESRNQPPADAHGAGGRQAARRQDRGDQPAPRGGADQVPQPAVGARRLRRRHQDR